MNPPTLHMLVGLPGSGKTTFAQQIQSATGAVRLTSDDFRLLLFPRPSFSQQEHDDLYEILNHNLVHLLESGRDVIYDANLNRHEHRAEKYAIAAAHNAQVVLWWLTTPDTLSKERRIASQNHTLVPSGETPERMFDRVTRVFEPPNEAENPIVFDGSTITAARVQEALDTL